MYASKKTHTVKVRFKNGLEREFLLDDWKRSSTNGYEVIEFFENGKKHNAYGPAEIRAYGADYVSEEYFFIFGEELSIIEFAQHLGTDHYRSQIQEIYLKDGKLHRENGPACIWYYDNGAISREDWFYEGKRHNSNGFSIVAYFQDGQPIFGKTYLNDEEIAHEMLYHLKRKDLK